MNRRPWWQGYGALVLILGFGLLLRLNRLGAQGLWIDEGYSVALARLAVPQIVAGTAADQHPPLYYLLLHGWMGLAGRSEFSVRLLSVAFGVLTIALLYTVGRQMISHWVGLLAALLLAVSPMHIRYSQETRMYALLAGLCLLSVYALWRLLERPSLGRAAAYALVTAAALYTHNFAIFIVLFESMWVIGRTIAPHLRRPGPAGAPAGDDRAARENTPGTTSGERPAGGARLLVGWLLCLAVVGLLWAAWLPTVWMQTRDHRVSWIGRPDLAAMRSTLLNLSTGAVTGRPGSPPEILSWVWLAVALVALVVAWKRGREQRPALALLALWFVVPAAAIVALSFRYPLYQDKQFLVLVPALILLLAAGLMALRPGWRLLAVAGLLALHAYPLYDLYFRAPRQQWREAAAYLDATGRPGDVIVLNAAAGKIMLDYYSEQSWPALGIPQEYDILVGGFVGQTTTPDGVDARLRPLLDSYRRVWLLEFTPEFWDPGRLLVAWLDGQAGRQAVPAFADLELRLYELGGPR